MKKKLLLFAGLHKTGSTSIQKFFYINKKNTKFYVPKSGNIFFNNINHANIAWEFLKESRFNKKYGTIKNLKDEIYDKKDVILLSEDFSLIFFNEKISKKFFSTFKDYNIYLIIFFRNKNDRVSSLIYEFFIRYRVNTNIFFATIGLFKDLYEYKKEKKNIYKITSRINNISIPFSFYKLARKLYNKKFFHHSLFEYNSKTNVIDILLKLNLFKDQENFNEKLNIRKNNLLYKILTRLLKTNIVKINEKRNDSTIKKLNIKLNI